MTGRFDLTSWCFKRLIKMLANSTLKFVTQICDKHESIFQAYKEIQAT